MALLNLAMNARDAVPSGGNLTITLDRQFVAAGDLAVAPGGYVRLSVQDTGEGMDAMTLARAVDPSFQLRGSARAPASVFPWCMGLPNNPAAHSVSKVSQGSERKPSCGYR
jgi:hypothetical protein